MLMSSPKFNGRFSAYTTALQAISSRTGTPVPSLLLSFGILHEITAVVPLFVVFYSSRALGVGERVVNVITDGGTANLQPETNSKGSLVAWTKRKLITWVEEGDIWSAKVGTRYGIFGYDIRKPGEADIPELTRVPGHIAGDVANAVVAYGVTKALLPVRIALSMYLSPAFSRGVVEPSRKFLVRAFGRKRDL